MARSDTKRWAPYDEGESAAVAASRSAAPASGVRSAAPSAAQRSMTDLFEVRIAMFEVPASDADRLVSTARELAAYVQAHEPRTRFFGILQDDDSPGRFVYAAVFDDVEAERTHRSSSPARRFDAALLRAGVRLESGRWTAVAGV